MTYLKNLGIAFGFMIVSLLTLVLFVTFLHYISWIGPKTLAVLEIIIPTCSLFLGGYIMGKKSKEKGWLEGLKLGSIFIIILVLFQYLGLKVEFSFKSILFYVLLLVSTTFGSMIGINKKAQ